MLEGVNQNGKVEFTCTLEHFIWANDLDQPGMVEEIVGTSLNEFKRTINAGETVRIPQCCGSWIDVRERGRGNVAREPNESQPVSL